MNDQSQNDYFQKKTIKEQVSASADRKRQTKKVAKWVVLFLIAVVVVYGLGKLLNRPEGPQPGVFYAAQSRDHIAMGSEHAEYNSSPPTGGWHYASPAQTGIYDVELPDEQVIHNLEHGHVWISYRSDVSQEQLDTLIKIANSYSYQIILTKREKNPTPIALVAWEYLLKLDTADEGQIRDFINAYRGRGPERIPDSGFDDFRGKTVPVGPGT